MMRLWLIILLAMLLNMPVLGQHTASEWIARGNELFQYGKYNESLQAFDKAIELDSNSELAWNSKGNVFDAMGKYDQAITSFDNARQIKNDFLTFGPIKLRIPTWIIVPFITVLIAIFGYFITYFINNRLSKRNAKLERVNRQLSELYGPLYALAHISNSLFHDLSKKLLKKGKDGDWEFEDVERKEWILWMQTVFMPINLNIYKLIRTKADLLIENDLDQSLLDVCIHVGEYKAMLKKWKEGDTSVVTPTKEFPDELSKYAQKCFRKLKKEQEELIGRHREGRRICPSWLAATLDNPFRRLIHNPNKILSEYIKSGQVVLDLGCGYGIVGILAAKILSPGMVTMVDIDIDQLGLPEKMQF